MRFSRKLLSFVFAIALLLSAFPATGFAYDAQTSFESGGTGEIAEDALLIPGELIVVFNENVSESAAERVIDAADGEAAEISETPGEAAVSALVELPEDLTLRAAMEAFSQSPLVDFVQPNYLYELAEEEEEAVYPAFSSNDANVSYQWHLDSIDVAGAWSHLSLYSGNTPVRVAVIDDNVYMNHADLDDNVNRDLARDFSDGTAKTPLSSYYGEHGTHVAGIIGAESNNGLYGVGVAAGARNEIVELVPINVFSPSSGGASSYAIAKAITYAEESAKVKVINMSLGYSAYSPDRYLQTVVSRAISNGVTVVCAAGNDGRNGGPPYSYPGDFDGVISVVNITKEGARHSSSNYGSPRDISAPGTSIYSTSTASTGSSSYAGATGTSMASPVVAGVAAMMLYVNSGLSPAQVERILKDTATRLDDATATGGKVNAAAAVREAARGLPLAGTVSVSGVSGASGAPRYGDILTADARTLTSPDPGALSYQWKRDGAAIDGAVYASYTVGIADIGHKISVTVTAENYTGGVTSAETLQAARAEKPDLQWPSAETIVYGAALSASALTGGSVAYGSFAWARPGIVPGAGTGSYDVSFTPSAEARAGYDGIAEATLAVSLTVNKAAAPSGVTRTFYVNEGQAYDFDLKSLLPGLNDLGAVTYGPVIQSDGGSMSVSLGPADGDTLPLQIAADAAADTQATVEVTISSANYADFVSTIRVKTLNKAIIEIEDLTPAGSVVYDGNPKDGYTGTARFSNANDPVDPSNPNLTAHYTGFLYSGEPYAEHTTTPSAAGTYTLRLTLADDDQYYAEWTGAFTIEKATPTPPSASVTAVYGQTLRDLTPPDGFSWTAPETSVGAVGERTFPALYTPRDTNNYNTVDANVGVTVRPKSLVLADLAAENRVYDGTTDVTLVGGRLEGLVAGDEGAVGFTIAGGAAPSGFPGSGAVSGVSVRLTGERASNYAQPAVPALTVTISQKPIRAEDITVAAPNKTYDGTDAASLLASFNPGAIIAGDDVRIALTGRYADANAGSGKRVFVDGWRLDGADAQNYTLDGPRPSGVTGTISTAAGNDSLGGGGGGGGGGGFSTSAETKEEEEALLEEAEADDANAAEESPAPTASGSAWVNSFVDIDESAWYYGDVAYAVTRGLFTGTDAAAFSPNEPMTRGMLVTVLGRLCGADVGGYTSAGFVDVAADMYYAPYIAWAAENGLVLGVGDGGFAPDAELTRQDLALIFMRCAAFRGDVLPETRAFVPFADEADISDYAAEATQRLFEAGLISGRPGNAFDPKGKATRAEVAAVLHRYLEIVEEAG
ncbi:MAG: S8 family serine peptidase [Clostridiales Family XIII bacterium]|jgi:subtilisin family serine protease|nr:S8 family serine peptidase [Clostridiales Family XIII bacterium]